MLDECFTKLEKAINFKEQRLVQTLNHLASTKKATESKTNKVTTLVDHVRDTEKNIKDQYKNKVNELEHKAMDMNTSQFRQSIAQQDEIDFYSHERQDGGFQDLNGNMGSNYSSVTFNNSVVDTIDNARMVEVD